MAYRKHPDTDSLITIGQASLIAEAAYRRGFQQGFQASQAGDPVRDLHDWRYNEPLEMAVMPQKGARLIKGVETPIIRMLVESNNTLPSAPVPAPVPKPQVDNKPPPEPLAYSVADACRVASICKSHLYNLIRAGKLETRKLGRRTVIPAHSLRALFGTE